MKKNPSRSGAVFYVVTIVLLASFVAIGYMQILCGRLIAGLRHRIRRNN